MPVPYPNLKPVRVELQLDAVESRGLPVGEMVASTARPMALSLKAEPMWYGFVINDASIESIQSGTKVTCTISFITHESAREAFSAGASVLFGDSVSTKGVIRIIGFE